MKIFNIPFPKSFPDQLLLRIQDVWINLLMHRHPEVAHENVPQSYFNRGSQACRLPLQTSNSRVSRPSHLPDATAPLSPSSRKLSEMHFTEQILWLEIRFFFTIILLISNVSCVAIFKSLTKCSYHLCTRLQNSNHHIEREAEKPTWPVQPTWSPFHGSTLQN